MLSGGLGLRFVKSGYFSGWVPRGFLLSCSGALLSFRSVQDRLAVFLSHTTLGKEISEFSSSVIKGILRIREASWSLVQLGKSRSEGKKFVVFIGMQVILFVFTKC